MKVAVAMALLSVLLAGALPAIAQNAPEDLLAEALAAEHTPTSDRVIMIPLPRVGEEGQFEITDGEENESLPFAWSATDFADEWGRTIHGVKLSYAGGSGSSCRAVLSNSPVEGSSNTAEAGHLYLFAPGVVAPVAASRVGSCFAGAMVDNDGAKVGAGGEWRLDYDEFPVRACLFRTPIQGTILAPGSRHQGVCDAFGETRDWFAGPIGERRGFSVIPLYHVEKNATITRVARIWFAHDLAYPLELDLFTQENGSEPRTSRYELTGLAVGSAPISNEPLDLPPPNIQLAAPDRLLGPSDSNADLQPPLSEASRAATADLSLTELQTLLAKKDAALIGAELGTYQPQGSPVVVQRWVLAYSAGGSAPILVVCERPDVSAAFQSPALRCRNAQMGTYFTRLYDAPSSFGAAKLPHSAPTFGQARLRWEAGDATAVGKGATHAYWQAWDKEFVPAMMELGSSGRPSTVPGGEEVARSFARLALDGHSIATISASGAPFRVTKLPADLSPELLAPVGAVAPGRDTPPGANAPKLIGVGIAVAAVGALVLLALFAKGAIAAFFTRLARPRVLDAELRARIHALVGEQPGIHENEIATKLERRNGVVSYHLDVLVRENFLVTYKVAGFRHYFPKGRYHPAQMRMLAALRVGQAEKLYGLIAQAPGIGMGTLVERSGLSQGYVSKEIKRLSAAGLVGATRSGRTVELRAISASEEN